MFFTYESECDQSFGSKFAVLLVTTVLFRTFELSVISIHCSTMTDEIENFDHV